jgi:Ca-activated chloride channel homolog
MRKPLLSLAAVALVATACSSSSSSTGPSTRTAPPQAYAPSAAASLAPPAYPQATPYDGVTFQDHGVNPFVDPREDRVSTFALDVDTASYAIAQRYVEDGNRPDAASVRVEEWVNAFDQGYRAPADDAFAISIDGGPTPFGGPDEVLVRVGLQAREVRDRQRQDASLTFVIDTSGSMEREGRLELVKDALRILVDELGPDDRVAVVTFGSDAHLALRSTSARDRDAILDAIDRLRPDGSTNLEAGLQLGYEQARRSLTEDGIDRVVIASDGVANVGLTDADGILRQVGDDAAHGIELVSIGVGMGNYNDALLERLADQGDGFYAYVNEVDDARTLFRERLTSTLQTVALDAKAQVEFDPRVVDAYRLVGYEDRDIPDGSFTDPRVDAGAIGAGHAVTALYAVRMAEDGSGRGPFATVRLRWTDPDTGKTRELSRDIRSGDLAKSFERTDPYFQLDSMVAAAAEVMRDSPYAGRLRIADIQQVAERGDGDLPSTDQVSGFLGLLEAMRRLDD